MSQEKRILEYMKKNGSITAYDALKYLGIMRLSARIWDLRAAGYPIVAEKETIINRYGEEVKIASYRLKKVDRYAPED